MMSYYARDGSPMSQEEWMVRFGDEPYKRVARTAIGGDVSVSTVWLGLDHGWSRGQPLIFETMVFGGPLDEYQERYATLEAAEAGHERWVAKVRAAVEAR